MSCTVINFLFFYSKDIPSLGKYIRKVNTSMQTSVRRFKAHTWFSCMPQIVSRIGHSNPDVVLIIKEILVKILVAFPQQVFNTSTNYPFLWMFF